MPLIAPPMCPTPGMKSSYFFWSNPVFLPDKISVPGSADPGIKIHPSTSGLGDSGVKTARHSCREVQKMVPQFEFCDNFHKCTPI